MEVPIKWAGKELVAVVEGDGDGDLLVSDLKKAIAIATGVSPDRQKLLNAKLAAGGKPAPDDALLSDLAPFKPGGKVSVLGTAGGGEDAALVETPPDDAPQVIDDFDIDVDQDAAAAIAKLRQNEAKLTKRIESLKLKELNPPRPGRKLLVLDIDYTLFDHRSPAERAIELQRPYLHEFLAQSYQHYDIIIWSATSMRWIELKMGELGVLSHPLYRVVTLLDHSAMITVHSDQYGVFDCKPLQVIWAKFPDIYHAGNTIMFDDLRRNFIMNPQNGLKIRPFRHAHLARATDNELFYLAQYLQDIASMDSIAQLDHSRWEQRIRRDKSTQPGS
eukprot:jgi/Chlat1/6996/Chrsp56S06680